MLPLMSDKEVIIKSLKKVERRLRSNRLLTDLTFSLSLFLLFIIGFKILDLISPFRGRTVATSEGDIKDASGKLYAHATTTCVIFPAK